ncbi:MULTISPECIES: ABC transporter substrate-binding protein [unclassified Thiocapsa]|uniref:ABC transporter substrate-binding protein n=1 Tax=unclassified Thiocapsa TaxID=2641286 RepID=UPI0035AEB31A
MMKVESPTGHLTACVRGSLALSMECDPSLQIRFAVVIGLGCLLLPLMAAVSSPVREDAAQRAVPATPVVVRLALQWRPQSQFAGYFMAREKGIYRASGLDVQLLHADAEHTSLGMLRDGSADLATAFLTDGIMAAVARAGMPLPGGPNASDALRIVQVAQIVQRSHLMLIAWKDMGVERAADLDGMRVSYWQGSFSAAFDAFFAAHNVEPIRIPQYESVNLFLKRGVAACAVMYYNEYHRIRQAGIDTDRLTGFVMSEEGFGFPEDGIYATAAWIGSHSEVARKVREATLVGWAYARDHPEETLDLVLAEAREAGVPANRPHERWMLERIIESIFVPDQPGQPAPTPGALDPTDFLSAAQALLAVGLVERIPRVDAFAPFDASPP